MFEWRRFLLLYALCMVGGAVVGLVVWLIWGDSESLTFIGVVTVPLVILLLLGLALRPGGIISHESEHDVYGVQHANRERRFTVPFSLTNGAWWNERLLSIAALSSGLTFGLLALILYSLFDIQ